MPVMYRVSCYWVNLGAKRPCLADERSLYRHIGRITFGDRQHFDVAEFSLVRRSHVVIDKKAPTNDVGFLFGILFSFTNSQAFSICVNLQSLTANQRNAVTLRYDKVVTDRIFFYIVTEDVATDEYVGLIHGIVGVSEETAEILVLLVFFRHEIGKKFFKERLLGRIETDTFPTFVHTVYMFKTVMNLEHVPRVTDRSNKVDDGVVLRHTHDLGKPENMRNTRKYGR